MHVPSTRPAFAGWSEGDSFLLRSYARISGCRLTKRALAIDERAIGPVGDGLASADRESSESRESGHREPESESESESESEQLACPPSLQQKDDPKT